MAQRNKKSDAKAKAKTIGKLGGEKIIIDEFDESNFDIIYRWIVEDEDDINQIK